VAIPAEVNEAFRLLQAGDATGALEAARKDLPKAIDAVRDAVDDAVVALFGSVARLAPMSLCSSPSSSSLLVMRS